MLAISETAVFSKAGAGRIACASGALRESGSHTSDDTLVLAIANGDRGAMKLLYARHHLRK